MRTTILICDHCNADMTDAVQKYGDWQGMYTVSGGRSGDPLFPRLDIEVCSLACLLSALGLASRSPR